MLTGKKNNVNITKSVARVTDFIWDHSSAGRASALQAGGHRFEPYWSHFATEYVVYGGIAQLARAHGSYPWCRWFESSSRYLEAFMTEKSVIRVFCYNFKSLLFVCKTIQQLRIKTFRNKIH